MFGNSLVDDSATWVEYTMWGDLPKPVALVHHGQNWRLQQHKVPAATSSYTRVSVLTPLSYHPIQNPTPHARSTHALTCSRSLQGAAGGRGGV
jgi:hypothetical protein